MPLRHDEARDARVHEEQRVSHACFVAHELVHLGELVEGHSVVLKSAIPLRTSAHDAASVPTRFVSDFAAIEDLLTLEKRLGVPLDGHRLRCRHDVAPVGRRARAVPLRPRCAAPHFGHGAAFGATSSR